MTGLPQYEDARNTIYHKVHTDAFFNKLAEYGHVPTTNEEAVALLDLSHKLAHASVNEVVKQASGPYAFANSAFDQAMPNYNNEHNLKQAAVALANDPEVYTAALAIKLAEIQ